MFVLGVFALPASAAAGEASMSVEPDRIDFGSQNSAGDIGMVQDVVIQSTGAGDLVVESVTVTGPGADAFPVHTDRACEAPLPSGSGCGVSVYFDYHGATGGPKEANLEIETNASETTHLIPLTGTVVHTKLTIEPEHHDFGTATAGSGEGPVKTFTITTVGSMPFSPGRPYISDPGTNATTSAAKHFKVLSHDCNQVVNIGASCTAEVAFRPTAGSTGQKSVWLSIGPGMIPASSSLIGKAVAPGTPPPPPPDHDIALSIRFQKKPKAGGKAVLVVRLRNRGTETSKAMSVRVKTPSRIASNPKALRVPGIEAGGSVTKRARFRVARSVGRSKSFSVTALVRSEGVKIAEASRTVRLR